MQSQTIAHSVPMRSTGTAYLWWSCLGSVGAHKFYLGQPVMGVLYAATFGFLGLGPLYDLFTLPGQVRRANEAIRSGAGFRTASGPLSGLMAGFADPPRLTEAAIDAMYARYAAERRAADPVPDPVIRGSGPASGPTFGKRRR